MAELLPKHGADYVKAMGWMSDAVAECAVPIPVEWLDQVEADAPAQPQD